MSDGGRPLDERIWIAAGALSCCVSAGISLAAILAGVSFILERMG